MNYNLNPIKGGERDKLNRHHKEATSQIQNVAISIVQMAQLLEQINVVVVFFLKRCYRLKDVLVLEVVAGAIRQENEIKSIQKGRSKLSLFADDMILYTESPKESKNKKAQLLKLMSSTSLQDIRAICKDHFYFYTLAVKNLKMKLRKQFHLQ